jgi:hypothetical protein
MVPISGKSRKNSTSNTSCLFLFWQPLTNLYQQHIHIISRFKDTPLSSSSSPFSDATIPLLALLMIWIVKPQPETDLISLFNILFYFWFCVAWHETTSHAYPSSFLITNYIVPILFSCLYIMDMVRTCIYKVSLSIAFSVGYIPYSY